MSVVVLLLDQQTYSNHLVLFTCLSGFYAWTAVAKINGEYLSGAVLDTFLRDWVPAPDRLLPTMAVGSIAAELFLAGALWSRRLLPVATAAGAMRHLGIVFLLHDPSPLVPFAMLMAVGYIQFWCRTDPQPADSPVRRHTAPASLWSAGDDGVDLAQRPPDRVPAVRDDGQRHAPAGVVAHQRALAPVLTPSLK